MSDNKEWEVKPESLQLNPCTWSPVMSLTDTKALFPEFSGAHTPAASLSLLTSVLLLRSPPHLSQQLPLSADASPVFRRKFVYHIANALALGGGNELTATICCEPLDRTCGGRPNIPVTSGACSGLFSAGGLRRAFVSIASEGLAVPRGNAIILLGSIFSQHTTQS